MKTDKWPDGTPKSSGNAFDLRTCPGELARHLRSYSAKSAAGMAGAAVHQGRIYAYSKAVGK